AGLCASLLTHAEFRHRLPLTALVTAVFALAAWLLRGVNRSGAASGFIAAFALTIAGGPAIFGAVLLVFVLTFLATRFGRQRKSELHIEERGKGRNGAQVLANIGCAAVAAMLSQLTPWHMPLLVGSCGRYGVQRDRQSAGPHCTDVELLEDGLRRHRWRDKPCRNYSGDRGGRHRRRRGGRDGHAQCTSKRNRRPRRNDRHVYRQPAGCNARSAWMDREQWRESDLDRLLGCSRSDSGLKRNGPRRLSRMGLPLRDFPVDQVPRDRPLLFCFACLIF